MRFELIIGGVCAAGMALAAVACGSSESSGTSPEGEGDGGETNASSSGGSSGKPGTSSSGGSSGTSSSGGSSGSTSGGPVTIPAPKELKAGGAILLGTTTDDQVIYLTVGGATNDIEAVPIGGGTPVKVVTDFDLDNDAFTISGGAVGWWTGITNSIGTFNVWNKTDGAKTALSAASAAGIFAASDDGLRIAFSTAADATNTDIQVANVATATAAAQGIFNVADEVNLAAMSGASPTCGLDMAFVGKKLFAAFCTGTSASATAARLYFVPESSVTEVRLDNVGAANTAIQPFWLPDDTGSKLFAIGLPPDNTGRIIDVAGTTSIAMENGTARSGFVTKDGSAVVYRTATGGIKRTATTAFAGKTLHAGAKGVLDISVDQSKLLFRTLDPTQNGVDIRSGDTTTENQTAKDIVTTATAQPIGLTGSATHAVYVTASGASPALMSKPFGGGAEKELAKDMDAVGVFSEGDGVIVLEKGVMQGQLTLYEVRYINAATGASSAKITDGVPDSGYALVKKKLVYTKIAQTGAGLFVVDVP